MMAAFWPLSLRRSRRCRGRRVHDRGIAGVRRQRRGVGGHPGAQRQRLQDRLHLGRAAGLVQAQRAPESALWSLAGGGPPGRPASSAPGLFGHSSAKAGPAPGSSGGPGLGIGTDVIFSSVLQAARHVSGSWGNGRLLRTPLISVLVTSNGRILFGAVTPEVLYRAATQAAHAPPAFWHHAAAARSK